MKKSGIIGAGAMGTGIAQVIATAGYEVMLYDKNTEMLKQSEQTIQSIVNKLLAKEKLSPSEAKGITSRIYYTENLNSFQDCDIVIEAIVEDLKIKQDVFRALENIVLKKTILASNTSSLSISLIGSVLKNPERMIGIHFFNPAPVMKLVEIIPAIQTEKETITKTQYWVESLGKVVVIAKDSPGFIVNKVARPYYSESIRILEEGIASVSAIDHILKTKGGFRMGPFELMDFIGHDINYKVTESVWKSFYYDTKYTPSHTQERLVNAGYLGKKTGKGFYDYQNPVLHDYIEWSDEAGERIFLRVISMLVNEAADTVYKGICSESDVELAMTLGVNYPKGLLEWGKEIGIDEIIKTLDNLYAYYHEERYRVSPFLRNLTKN